MRFSRAVWLLVDCLLVAAALVAVGRVVVHHLVARAARAGAYPPLVVRRSTLTIPSVNWADAPRHVVLRISSTCPTCLKSVPFYQDISRRVHSAVGTRLIVVTNEPPESISRWLGERDISADRVVHVPMPYTLGFLLIPTVLMADSSGQVTDILVGGLTQADQDGFVDKLSVESSPAILDNTKYAEEIDSAELIRRTKEQAVTVLDVRDRDQYTAGHWSGAVNIPRDELDLRSAVELGGHTSLVLDCRELSPISCRTTARTLRLSRSGPVAAVLR